jgi:AcrR family transcriptional regulator
VNQTADSLPGLFALEARGRNKSARTRARLMDAAVTLFAREGFEAASVNEIARLAEVANGTFYVHFKDRDEIAAAVAFGVARELAAQIAEAMTGIEDAIERTTLATCAFIDMACSRPDWGRALFRAAWRFPELRAEVLAFVRADLELGARQGSFTTPIDEFVAGTHGAMTLSTLYSRLEGLAGLDAGPRVAELQLLMLGVTPDRAREAAWRERAPLSLRMPG